MTAQAAFKSGKSGAAESKGYWRDDVAGLYAIKGNDGQPIGLIELSTAAADRQPTINIGSVNGSEIIASPKAGYWYRALRYSDEKAPSPLRFAICAYPDTPLAGKWMYLISEEGILRRKQFGGTAPTQFPADPEKEGWERRLASDSY